MAVHLPIAEPADVFSAVSHSEDALAAQYVITEFANVFSAVSPCEGALAASFVIPKFADVFVAIRGLCEFVCTDGAATY